jgi:hypothetical protein
MISCVFMSCAAFPKRTTQLPAVSYTIDESAGLSLPQRVAPGGFAVPPPVSSPVSILGRGRVGSKVLADFLCRSNPEIDSNFARELAQIYIEEASLEGVNSDVAFSQMCLETGFLAFGGLVTSDMNNFCGLGSIGPGQKGEHFPTPRIGVRAQIQHLKAYATDAPLLNELVDPRYRYVRYGTAPTIDGLAGTWAADKDYGRKLKSIIDRLTLFSHNPSSPVGMTSAAL